MYMHAVALTYQFVNGANSLAAIYSVVAAIVEEKFNDRQLTPRRASARQQSGAAAAAAPLSNSICNRAFVPRWINKRSGIYSYLHIQSEWLECIIVKSAKVL